MTLSRDSKKTEKKLTVTRLNDIAFAFKQSGTLVGAIELNIFTAVSECDGPADPGTIAKKINLPVDAVERLMIGCAALGVLEKDGEKYTNAPDVEKFLVKTSRTYFGDFLVFESLFEYDLWKGIATNMKRKSIATDQKQSLKNYDITAGDPGAARAFTEAGYNSAISSAHKLAKEFDFSRFSLWIDLGGGSGAFPIAAATRHPNFHAIVMDFPNVVAVADEFITNAGLSDRIQTQAGNFVTDEFPKGADLISYITPLQSYEKDEVVFLLKKAFDAVQPGGSIIVIDYMMNNTKTGPLDPVFHNLSGVVQDFPGRVNSESEFCEYLANAGFIDMEVNEFVPGVTSRIIARKPL